MEESKHGGAREGAGRKPKADELAIIEKLSPLEDEAFKQLEKGVKSGSFHFVKLFYEYIWGKPKQSVDLTTKGESMNKQADYSKLSLQDLILLRELESKASSD